MRSPMHNRHRLRTRYFGISFSACGCSIFILIHFFLFGDAGPGVGVDGTCDAALAVCHRDISQLLLASQLAGWRHYSVASGG